MVHELDPLNLTGVALEIYCQSALCMNEISFYSANNYRLSSDTHTHTHNVQYHFLIMT